MDAIKTTNLTKRYNDLVAVDNLCLEIKQGEIFSLLGVWRNIVATIGIAVIVILTYSFLTVYLPLALAVVVICGIAICIYLGAYAAYPKIKEYMIDPYYKEEEYSYFNEGDDEEELSEPICRDDV